MGDSAASLSHHERAGLAAFCDTIVPRIERADDPDGFWARAATDIGVERGVEDLIAQIPDEAMRAGLAELLQGLYEQGLPTAPSQPSREQLVRNLTYFSADAAAGVAALAGDRKSTRLNSSHANISYAVFCLKKKKNNRR